MMAFDEARAFSRTACGWLLFAASGVCRADAPAPGYLFEFSSASEAAFSCAMGVERPPGTKVQTSVTTSSQEPAVRKMSWRADDTLDQRIVDALIERYNACQMKGGATFTWSRTTTSKLKLPAAPSPPA
jgi:hypothetical protein